MTQNNQTELQQPTEISAPTLPSPATPQEVFPGFSRQLQTLGVQQVEAHRKVSQAEQRLRRAESASSNLFRKLQVGPNLLSFVPGLATPSEADLDQLRAETDFAVQEFKSIEWRLEVLQTMPGYLSSPTFSILKPEDILQFVDNEGASADDMEWLERTFESMKFLTNVLPEGFDGDIADAQKKLIDEVLKPLPLPLRAVHNLTVDELARTFQPRVGALPQGLTTEDVRSLLAQIDLEEETRQEVDEFLRNRAAKWAVETDRINLLRAGLVMPDEPSLTPIEFGKLLLVQPMLATVETLDKYFNILPRPLAAAAIIGVHRLFKTAEDTNAAEMERLFDFYKGQGESTRSSYARAFNEWDAPWFQKLLTEFAFDPTSYLGFGMAGAAATKLGAGLTKVGLSSVGTRIGPAVFMFEHGYQTGADAIFKAGLETFLAPAKAFTWATRGGYRIPQTFTVMSRSFARKTTMDVNAVLHRLHPGVKRLEGLTSQNIKEGVELMVRAAVDRPLEGTDLAVRAGGGLLEFNYADDVATKALLKDIVDVTVEFDTTRLSWINTDLLDMFTGGAQGARVTAGKILGHSGIDATEELVSKLAVRLTGFKDRIVKSAIDAASGNAPKDIFINLFEHLESTRMSNLTSDITRHMAQAGRAASWHSRVADKILYSAGLVALERKFVMPFARLNLLFMNFGPANFFENMQRSWLGGAEVLYPRAFGGVSETTRLFQGLPNSPHELVLFERGENRLAESVVDKTTGQTTVFQGGHIPFITRDVSFPDKLPFLGGTKIGKTINIAGQDHYIGSAQDLYDLWASLNSRQVAYDYQVHYLKALQDQFPDEYNSILDVLAQHKVDLDSVSAFSSADAKDIERILFQDGTVSPEAIRANANLDVFELERRQISKELGKTLSRATEVSTNAKSQITNEILDGSMFANGATSIDERMAAHLAGERERSIATLTNQIDTLKEKAEAYTTNPPTNLQEFMSDLEDITSMMDASAEQIGYYRRITELRKQQLTQPRVRDQFEMGSARQMQDFMEAADEELGKMMNQLKEYASNPSGLVLPDGSPAGRAILNDNQLARLSDLDGVTRRRLNNILEVRTRNSIIDAKASSTPSRQRNKSFWDGQTASKNDSWNQYFANEQPLRAADLMARRNFLTSVDQPAFVPEFVPEVIDKLTPNHLAFLFGVTGDDLYRGLTRVQQHITVRPREEFILYAQNQADVYAQQFGKNAADIGFTSESIGDTYDQMWRSLGIEPTTLTPDSPTAFQIDDIRQDLHRLHTSTRLPEADAIKFSQYVNKVADDIEKLPIYQEGAKAAQQPQFDVDWSNIPKGTRSRLESYLAELPASVAAKLKQIHIQTAPKIQGIHTTVETGVITAGSRGVITRFNFFHEMGHLAQPKEVLDRWRLAWGDTIGVNVPETFADTFALWLQNPSTFDKAKLPRSASYIPSQQRFDEVAPRLKEFFEKEFASETVRQPSAVTTRWLGQKEAAMTTAREQHALSYPTYGDVNLIEEGIRSVMPFANYELFRWRWIPRTWLRTPGTMVNLARWTEYSDSGYIPIPGTDLQLNPLRGSVWMGGLRSMYLKDFPEYYDAIPGMEAVDYLGRLGFFPGIHVMAPIVVLGATAGGKPEFNEISPSFVQSTLSALRALSPEHLGKVIDIFYPDRFRDFQTMLTLGKQGHDADEIWRKRQSGQALTDEEEKLWLQAGNEANGIKGILMQQTGLFRIRPNEYTIVRQEMRLAIEEAIGVPVAIQERIDRLYPTTGKRLSDYYQLDVLQQKLLYEWETYRRWRGISASLFPSGWQQMDIKIADYFETLEKVYNEARLVGVYEDGKLVRPSMVEANRQWIDGEIGPDQWLSLRDTMQSGLSEATRVLGESPAYKDVPKTLEEREEFLASRGIVTPTYGPDQELLWYYYQLKPEYTWDWDAARFTFDYETYYGKIDILLDSLSQVQRERLLERIQLDWTPMERLYWTVSRDFFRAHRNIRGIVLAQFEPEQRQQIRRFEVARGDERTALQEVIGPDGDNLISGFERRVRESREQLRFLDPTLDAWLSFFGKTDVVKTAQAEAILTDFNTRFLTTSMIK